MARAVDGRRLESVEAIGKHLLLRFEGGVTVRSHLRMNGRWRVGPVGSTGAGRPWLVLQARRIEATQWNGPVLTLDQRPVRRLGPDLLADATEPEALVPRLRRAEPDAAARRGAPGPAPRRRDREHVDVGDALGSSALAVASVGGGDATTSSLAALEWARSAMRASVAGARRSRAVYRRAGRPCPRCGTPIESRGQGDDNRTAYWCPPVSRRLSGCGSVSGARRVGTFGG